MSAEPVPAELLDEVVVISGPIPGVIDLVEPSIGQFIVGLHGLSVLVDGSEVTLDTARSEVVDGVERLVPSARVRFVSEGLIDRVLHAAVRPEAAFFFLLAGLTLAVFEFYAAGPGLAAAVAVVCLLSRRSRTVGDAHLVARRVRDVSVGSCCTSSTCNATIWDGARSSGPHCSASGVSASWTERPWLVPSWWVVLIVVTGIALFFGLALTTMVRARFSTQTIGRDHLIGRRGVAVGPITPDGEVDLGGTRWRARSTRRSGIAAGDAVVVVRIDGVVVEVDPTGQNTNRATP